MNIRLHFEPTDRSDVMCCSCLQFGADHVMVRADGSEADTGIHKKCAAGAAAKFTRQRRAA